jgi:hypothetical protein
MVLDWIIRNFYQFLNHNRRRRSVAAAAGLRPPLAAAGGLPGEALPDDGGRLAAQQVHDIRRLSSLSSSTCWV